MCRFSVFVDVVHGTGTCEDKVFCITQQGLLCIFDATARIVEKWIQLDMGPCFAMEWLSSQDLERDGLVVVGGANGIVKVFTPSTLTAVVDLPLPPSLTRHSSVNTTKQQQEQEQYAACYALRRIGDNKLMCVYADRTLIVFDLSDVFDVVAVFTSTAHRACVWDVIALQPTTQTQQQSQDFATCSADETVSFWNLNEAQQSNQISKSVSFKRDSESINTNIAHNLRESLASTATGLSITHAHGERDFDFTCGIPDLELPDRISSSFAPRVLALHPNGRLLAVGDKTGRLYLYNVETHRCVLVIQAHSAEILSMSFSPLMTFVEEDNSWIACDSTENNNSVDNNQLVLLATAGRDRLIHVFDVSISSTPTNEVVKCSPIDTLDHHSSSVTSVVFTNDGKRMLSTSGDKSLAFCNVQGRQIELIKSVQTSNSLLNGLCVDPTNKFAITSGSDKRLSIWNIHTGKLIRTYKNADCFPR